MKVSVIIPFYKVEPFVERCTRSLLEQTLTDVEFIFVDDASPDGSRAIIERVSAEYNRDVRILTHEQNQGLPAARNTGLGEARGEFIYHCDSDDYLEPTMLEDMYHAATAEKADFVYCDFYLDFGTSRREMTNPSYTDPEQMVKEGFLAGLMKYNVWNKLVARRLYSESGIVFPAGHGMGEDMTMILLATHATRSAHVAKPLYHYVKLNANAFSNTFSERHLTGLLQVKPQASLPFLGRPPTTTVMETVVSGSEPLYQTKYTPTPAYPAGTAMGRRRSLLPGTILLIPHQ